MNQGSSSSPGLWRKEKVGLSSLREDHFERKNEKKESVLLPLVSSPSHPVKRMSLKRYILCICITKMNFRQNKDFVEIGYLN